MRLAAFLLAAAMAGSTTGPGEFSGKHAKNGGIDRVERLGVMRLTELPVEYQCKRPQVRWCADQGRGVNCKCVYVREAGGPPVRMVQTLRNRSPVR